VRVLIDTPIWSLALRRKQTDLNSREQRVTITLRELIREGRAELVGPVCQELLSGMRAQADFLRLRDQLRAFEQTRLDAPDYEEAAHVNNQCRAQGISGSAIDFLICATAIRRAWQIFTTDRDFAHYAKVVPLNLYHVG
jgi:predicted nucleic acid-binding protein